PPGSRHRTAGALGLRRRANSHRHLPRRGSRDLGRNAADHAEPARRHRDARVSPPPSLSAAGVRRGIPRPRSSIPWWLVLVVIPTGGIAMLVPRAEPSAPTASLETPIDTLGRATTLRVAAHDRGSGLARIEVRLVPAGGGNPAVVASAVYPAIHWGWSR